MKLHLQPIVGDQNKLLLYQENIFTSRLYTIQSEYVVNNITDDFPSSVEKINSARLVISHIPYNELTSTCDIILSLFSKAQLSSGLLFVESCLL